MLVAHICQDFSLLSETFVYDTVVELERQRCNCHVLTNHRVNETDRPFEKVHLSIPAMAWHPARVASKLKTLATFQGREAYLVKLQRREMSRLLWKLQPDVIHAHFGPTGVLVKPVADQLGIPLIVTFYGYDISRTVVLEKLESEYQQLFSSSALLIGVSDHVRKRIIYAGADSRKVRRIRLGVDPHKFIYSAPASRFDGREVRLLHVGRLIAKKSPLELLDAFFYARQLLVDKIDLKLTIVGDGTLMPDVRQRVGAHGLEQHVELLGEIKHEEVRELYRQTHIYAQHSVTAPSGDQEGQPVSLIEAAASGLPIVSTYHSGIPDLVMDGETGYLVEEHDVNAMGERIAYLACHPELWTQFGLAGRARVKKEFSLETETGKLIDSMREVVDARR